MPSSFRRLALAAAALIGCGGGSESAPEEFLLHNAKVFTADFEAPWAEALLIRGDRIAAVGTTADVRAAASAGARMIDLGGKTVVPGFNDAHDHVTPSLPAVQVSTGPDPLPDPPFRVVADSLRAAVARTAPGTRLRVAVGERVLSDPAARRPALDLIAPAHPVEVQAWSGHGLILNSAALSAAGLADSTPDPLGGRFERDRSGRLTGLLEEYAAYSVWSRMAVQTDSAVRAAFAARADEAIRLGITSIQNMSTGLDPAVLGRVLDSLGAPIRVRIIRLPTTSATGRVTEPWQALRSAEGSWATVSGTKYVLDGTPVERLAAMRRPYSDRPGAVGRLNFPADTLRAILQDALTTGDQPMIHAVGDSAVGIVLGLMTELGPDSAWRRIRPRIEHGDGLSPDQYALAQRLGAIVVQNPSHLTLGPLAAARYGPARMAILQPLKSVLSNGMMLALGSDGPINPFLNIMFAVMHPDNPAEALTVEQAVRAYTLGSAFAEHQELRKGRLAIGMLADLAVLSQDIFTIPAPQLPATTSVLTVIGGRPVLDPGGLFAAAQPIGDR